MTEECDRTAPPGRPLGLRLALLFTALACVPPALADGAKPAAPAPAATTSFPSLQAAIDAANRAGGQTLIFPTGENALTATLNLAKGAYLVGQCPGGSPDAVSPYIVCSAVRPGASLSALISQSSLASPVVGTGLQGLLIDGCKSTTAQCAKAYTVANLVHISPVGNYFEQSFIGNGSGNCVYYQTNPTADWINWFDRNSISHCAGVGLNWEGTDSAVFANYITGNGVAALFNTTGARVALNQFEVSSGDGVQVKNLLSVGFPGTDVVLLGNLFSLNKSSDLHFLVGAGVAHTARGPVVANMFAPSSGVIIDDNVTNGLFVGDSFDGETMGYDVKFGGKNNSGWQFIGVSSSLPPSARFVNLPLDAQVVSGGPGGAWNRLQSLILAAPVAGSATTVADATLNVYGSSSVLGAANVAARFGVGRNASPVDAALLVGATNGNTPYVDAANGEWTAAVALALKFNNATIESLDANGATFNKPIFYSGTLPTGTPASYACFTSAGKLISSSRPC